ncbi:MAG: EAL domain-containing protein [Gammaproteobacteria bacterium]|jgi:diguanylate cyclase (GGDEF)-like protein/PAS domain S-box-containing protein|nr:EAL domain-containing protein [Gammaproteobacteria bacterium]
MSVLGPLTLLFAFAALVLLVLWLFQRRDMKALGRLTKLIQAAGSSSRPPERIDLDSDHPELSALAASVNQLLGKARRAPATSGAAALFAQVGDRVHEVVLLHRDSIVYANPQFAQLLGVDRMDVVGRRLADLVPPEQVELVAGHLQHALAGEEAPARFEVDLIGMQGQLSRLEISPSLIEHEGSKALLITGVEVIPTQTVSALSTGNTGIFELGGRSRARLALESLGEALITVDTAGRIDYANAAASAMLGAGIDTLLNKTLDQVITLVDETDRKLLKDPIDLALRGTSTVGLGRRAFVLSRRAGSERSIELTASPLRSRDNAAEEITGAVVLLHDVTELRGITRQMSYQATHDALTGLVNRREFERRLAESLDAARRGDGVHMLCFLDLDHFKAVNDSSGHQAGDSLLREVAKVMRQAVRDSDTVARLGGDEFGLLLMGCPLQKGRQIADDLARTMSEHRFVWKDRIHTIGTSIGLVELARDSGSVEETLAAADSACYVAKKQGPGKVTVYSARDEMAARQSGDIQWLRTLQVALRDNRFRLFWQPIVSAFGENGGGPAMEVLVRLADEQGQELSAGELVRAAERYRLMGLVDRWVVQTTFTALGRGAISLPAHRTLALNISGQTLADVQFLEFVVECFDRSGADPAQVCFEISESAVAANLEAARRFVGVLHGMGCQFALDDFGSDLGSFSSLKNLPMDFLKIDGSFMRNLARDSVSQAMVTATIKLARSLNFKVIAEQVEDAAGLDAARSMGVDYVQGYAVGRPKPLNLAAA